MASVTMGLISSGKFLSPLRKPAYKCTTGKYSFFPVIEQALYSSGPWRAVKSFTVPKAYLQDN